VISSIRNLNNYKVLKIVALILIVGLSLIILKGNENEFKRYSFYDFDKTYVPSKSEWSTPDKPNLVLEESRFNGHKKLINTVPSKDATNYSGDFPIETDCLDLDQEWFDVHNNDVIFSYVGGCANFSEDIMFDHNIYIYLYSCRR